MFLYHVCMSMSFDMHDLFLMHDVCDSSAYEDSELSDWTEHGLRLVITT